MSLFEIVLWLLLSSYFYERELYFPFFMLLSVVAIQYIWRDITLLLEKLDRQHHLLHKHIVNLFKVVTLTYQTSKFTLIFFIRSFLKNIYTRLFLVIFLFFLVPLLIGQYEVIINVVPVVFDQNGLAMVLNNKSVTDKDLDFIFSIIFRSLWIFGPLSITFYIFTYREQKGSSYSNQTTGGATKLLLFFLFFSIITVVYSFILTSRLTSYINTTNEISDLAFFSANLQEINLIMYMFLLSLLLGILVIFMLWRGINLDLALKQSTNKTKETIRYLSFISTKLDLYLESRKEVFNNLHHSLETNYQLLISALDNNTFFLFNIYYEKLEVNLKYLHTSPRIYYLLNEPRYMYFLHKDPSLYKLLYKAVLKNHLTLIRHLLEKKKVEEADKAIKCFFSLSPGGFSLEEKLEEKNVEKIKSEYKELVTIYFIALYELSLLISIGGFFGLDQILKNMNQIEEEEDLVRKKDTIIVYRALIISAIEKNDLKLLTETVNSIIHNTSYIEKTVENIVLKPKITINGKEFVLNNRNLEVSTRMYDEKVEGISQNEYEQVIIHTLLEAILKSIELGYYSCTGYLIKVLTGNLSYSKIKNSFATFAESKGLESHPLINSSLKGALGKEFNISPVSVEYCLQKLTIILYTQQEFYKKYKEPVDDTNELIDTTLTIKNTIKIEYLHDKIANAADKYGLLCLTRENMLDKTKKDLFKNIALKESLNMAVPERIEDARLEPTISVT